MMQAFRSVAGKVAAFVFSILMLVFLWTSVDWSQIAGGSRSTVGSVNGVKIPLQAFQQVVQQELEGRQRQTGRALTAEEIEEVREDVWQNLVRQQTLQHEYRERGLSVAADEVSDAILNNPPPQLLEEAEFQTEGKFDPAKYQRWLRSPAAAQYVPLLEAQYRDQILQSKLLRVVTADVYLSDAALWQAWRDANEKVTIELAAIVPRNAVPDSAVSITPEEVRRYYDEHRDQFRRPATAYLSYVAIRRFADASDSVAARERALGLRKEIQQGTPFEEVATRESGDTASAARGGDLGETEKGTLDPAVERAAWSLPVGAVSQPVLSDLGYHLVRVDSRRGNKVHARHILIPVEIVGAHRDALDRRADSLDVLGAEKLDPAAFDSVARILGLSIGSVNPVQRGTRAQVGFQVVPDAGVWAFQSKVGETSRIIELPYAYFLFRLDSLQPDGVPPFEAIRDGVTLAARDAKKWEGARQVGQDLVRRITEGSSLDQAATALRLPHQQFGPFTRITPPFPNARVVGAAYGVAPGKASGLIDTEEGLYVLRVVKREPADSAEFLKQLEPFRDRQYQLARQDRVRSYLDALVAGAEVADYRDRLFRTEAQDEQAQTTRTRS